MMGEKLTCGLQELYCMGFLRDLCLLVRTSLSVRVTVDSGSAF
jgi:hypothetical protein